MRITTNSVMRGYKSNLFKSFAHMKKTSLMAMNYRKFQKSSEAPGAAAKAFQVRREFLKNKDYIENVKETLGKFSTMESTMRNVLSEMPEVLEKEVLKAINGTNSKETREIIATKLDKIKELVVGAMNSTYGGEYIFGGSETKKAPFKWDGTKLLYRGEDVDDDTEMANFLDDPIYTDIGSGLKVNAGNIEKNTVFDSSKVGVELLGHGKNADGISKNLVVLIDKLAKELRKDPINEDDIKKLTDQFVASRQGLINATTNIGTEMNYLEKALDRMQITDLDMEKEIGNIEYVPAEEAYTLWEEAKASYTAALKVGSGILSNSFIDFMR